MNNLQAISPVDGRYNQTTTSLSEFFSEAAFFRYRVMVEAEYLIALSALDKLNLRKFTREEVKALRALYENFSVDDAGVISDIEKKGYKDIPATNHDVKAVEYFIKDKLSGMSLKDSSEWVHFALTSEDINNLAHALMLRESLEKVMLPAVSSITAALEALAKQHATIPMLARTHGQSASPTTFGKEFKVFASRLDRQVKILRSTGISAKLNGATGNYNAHVVAYPKINWPEFSLEFIGSFNDTHTIKLNTNLLTTQIEPHDSYIEIFDALRRINTILIDFNQDMWRYISDEWIVQKSVAGEIGSSAMPHKINPIKFENSEGNLGLANALFEFFARKLPVSRLQRDLSDSTVARNFGSAFAYCLIAYENILKGLERIDVNAKKASEDLENHPEVIAEAIQTILRREGIPMPYEKLKELTRGKKVSLADLAKFIEGLEISDSIKAELKAITPANYIGLASQLTDI